MQYRYVIGLILAMSFVSSLPYAHAAETQNVILSEIAWAGSTKSTADEWIELANLGNEAVNISEWQITGAGSSGGTLTLPTDATISAGGTFLIANYAAGNSSTLTIAPNYVTTSVSIPNSAITITLRDATGAIVDSITDPGAPNAGSSTTFASMERSLSDFSWISAETSTNLLNDQLGSPGIAGHVTAPIPELVITEPEVVAENPGGNEVTEMINTDSSSETQTNTTTTPDSTPIVEESTQIQTTTNEDTASTTEDPTTQPTDSLATEGTLPTETPVIETEVAPSTPTLQISGFLPSPSTGNNEWVEIANTGDAGIDLSPFSLVDANETATTLSGVILPNSIITVTNPKGKLNNDGDTISLIDPAGNLIGSVQYGTDTLPAPEKDVALRWINNAWTTVACTQTSESEAIVSETAPIETPAAIAEETSNTTTASEVTESTTNTETTETANIASAETTEASSQNLTDAPGVPSESDEETTSSSSLSPTVLAGDVAISAALPSPNTGDDEWVELTNTTSSSIDLSLLALVDGSGATTNLSGILDPNSSIYILNPKGNLNNDGDEISLTLLSGTVIDAVAYGTSEVPAPKKGESITFSSADLTATLSPTLTYENTTTSVEAPTSTSSNDSPGASSASRRETTRTNTVAATSTTTPTTHSTSASTTRVTSTTKKTSTVAAPRFVNLDTFDTLADDTPVTIEGVVVALPELLGKRSFFIDGLEVYQHQGTLADVNIGDRARITGAVSVLTDHRRINMKEGGVTKLEIGTAIIHDYTDTLRYGSLVRITGTISARDGNAMVLTDADGNTMSIIPGPEVSVAWETLANAEVSIIGILKKSSNSSSIVLRSGEDITVLTPAETQNPTIAATSQSSIPWVPLGIGTLTCVGLGFWFFKTRPQSSLTLKPSHV